MRHLLLLIGCCLGGLLPGQHQDITFTATASKQRMLRNSTLEYQLTLRNAQGEDLRPPAFDDFVVLQGPSRSIGTTIVNGVATSRMTFAWMLQPRRTGELTIEPASIRAAGRTYRANSQRVTVLEADRDVGAAAPDNFLEAEVSTDRAYVGQQIILNLNLYSTVNPISRNMVREPDLDGFFARVRRRFDAAPVSVVRGGREYRRRTLASIALFPMKSGTLTIDPYRMIIGAVRFRSNSTFSRRYTEQIPVNSDTLYVQVMELPQPRPDNFSGGVGSYRMEVQVDRNEMTTDDALTLNLQVTGQGDIQRLEAPVPVDEQDWYVYDPRVINEEFLDSPSGMFGRKTFQYQLIPRRGGSFTLRPAVAYFSTDSSNYVELTADPIEVTVSGGAGTPTYTIDAADVATEQLSLRPAPPLRPGRRPATDLAARPLFWGLFLLPLLAGGALLGYQRYRERAANVDPAIGRRAAAGRVATRRLRAAREHLDQVAARPFYDAVEGALLHYLRDRFDLRNTELSRGNITGVLREAGLVEELIADYDNLLQRCEMALYAGQDSATDLQDTYQRATELITATERHVA